MVVVCCNEPSRPPEGAVGYRGRGSTKKVELLVERGIGEHQGAVHFLYDVTCLGPTLLWLLWTGTKKVKHGF